MENLDGYFEGSDLQELTSRFEKMLNEGASGYYEVDELEELLEHYLMMHKLDLAGRVVEVSKQQNPYNKQLCIKEAEWLSMSNKPQEALDVLSEVETLEVFNPDFHITKANILSQCGLYKKAIQSLHKAMECSQEELDLIYLNLAIEYQNLEQYPEAIEFLKKSLDINPESDDAIYELAYCYELSKNYSEAVSVFNKIIDQAPYNVHAWFNLGASHQAEGEFEKALVAFDYAIIIDEGFHAAFFNKANVLVKMEKYAEAIELYKKALSFEILDSLIYFYIGDCYDNLSDYKNALAYFERAIRKDNEMAEAWIGASSCLDMLERSLEAIEYARKAVKLEDENGDYWCFLAGLENKYDLPDEAINSYEKALKHGYAFDDIYEEYAQLCLSQKNPELLREIVDRGLKEYSDNKLLHVYKAIHHYLRKEDDLGFEILVEVILQEPSLMEEFVLHYPKALEKEEIICLMETMRKV